MPLAPKKPTVAGKGQSKKVGCGHASCKVGKGCSMKTGKGQSVFDDVQPSPEGRSNNSGGRSNSGGVFNDVQQRSQRRNGGQGGVFDNDPAIGIPSMGRQKGSLGDRQSGSASVGRTGGISHQVRSQARSYSGLNSGGGSGINDTRGHRASRSNGLNGRGQSKKVGRGQDAPKDRWSTDPPQVHDEFEASRRATVPLAPRTPNSGMGEHLPYEQPVGGGQAKKPVGRGQSAPPKKAKAQGPVSAPKKGKQGAQPLPNSKPTVKKVSRRHRPPMNRKPPAAMPQMPGGTPQPGIQQAPMGPPMGMPPMPPPPVGMPPRPPMGMGQSRKRY